MLRMCPPKDPVRMVTVLESSSSEYHPEHDLVALIMSADHTYVYGLALGAVVDGVVYDALDDTAQRCQGRMPQIEMETGEPDDIFAELARCNVQARRVKPLPVFDPNRSPLIRGVRAILEQGGGPNEMKGGLRAWADANNRRMLAGVGPDESGTGASGFRLVQRPASRRGVWVRGRLFVGEALAALLAGQSEAQVVLAINGELDVKAWTTKGWQSLRPADGMSYARQPGDGAVIPLFVPLRRS